jgi:muramoyltetrapeptide carboxypeptidase
MKISRRGFVISGFSFLASANILLKGAEVKQDTLKTVNVNPPKSVVPPERLIPKALRKGSVIAITAPASYTNTSECIAGINFFKSMGCKIVVGKTLDWNHIKYKFLSAPDKERAKEFMEFVSRKDIDCILCARGGYGIMRLLPMLDFDLIRENPKVIIGFSDITGLINSIYQQSGLVTFHGSVASSTFNNFSKINLQNTIFQKKEFKPVKITYPSIQTITTGIAQGRLVGGNLSILSSLMGTPYEIDTKDKILLIEEVSEEPYKVDRMLTQLWLGGKLQQASGIIFGYFKNLDTKRDFYPGHSYTIREIIENRIKPLKIPAIIGLPFGHSLDNLTLPLGIHAELDSKKKTFALLESPVEN